MIARSISPVRRGPGPLASTLLLALLVTAGGCTSVKLNKDAATLPQPATTSPSSLPADPGVSGVTSVTPDAGTVDPLNDPDSPLSKRAIYFDLDSFTIQPQYQTVLEEHARYLTSHRDRQVMLEGNTDELGSREYNIALGQKRADAVRRALSALGVTDTQMEAVSFGEEKATGSGGDEAARAENRRVDLNYRMTTPR